MHADHFVYLIVVSGKISTNTVIYIVSCKHFLQKLEEKFYENYYWNLFSNQFFKTSDLLIQVSLQ